VLSLERMNGVVAFPRSMRCFALVIAQGSTEPPASLGYLWTAAIVASAVPIGGHYASDLVGGASSWPRLVARSAGPGATRAPRHRRTFSRER
jgi:hypothetical protein